MGAGVVPSSEGNTGRTAIARYGRTPRGRRPRARSETSWTGIGRSRVWPRPMVAWSALETGKGNTAMNGRGKSDKPIVLGKRTNKGRGAPRPAESVEERGLTKGNAGQQNRTRTQRRRTLQRELDRVRQVARKDRKERFTALWHHVYNVDRLLGAYLSLKRHAAAGVDGEMWQTYGENLEDNLRDLSERLKRGAYRAKPVRRVFIPKADGRQRPIGVPTLEDKIVQRAAAEVLNAIYEVDFLGFSYGFRPGRSQHNALDALTVGIESRKVNWVLDADIRGFFRRHRPRVAGEVRGAPNRGPARRGSRQKVAERGRAGG